jgi:hypothetical protein
MRKVFTNIFQNRTEHARQCARGEQAWRFAPGLRWQLYKQRRRAARIFRRISEQF